MHTDDPGRAEPADDVSSANWSRKTARRMFEELLGDFPDGALIFDDEHAIVAANEACCRIYERDLEELIGLQVHELAVESRGQVERRLAAFHADGRHAARMPIRTGTGQVRLVDYSARAEIVPGRHIAFVRDVTEEARRQRELDVRAGVLDSLEAGVYVVGRAGRITVWNRAAEEITGYSAAEAIGSRVEDLGIAPPSEIDAVGRRVLQEMQTDRSPSDGRAPSLEIVGLRRRKDGTIFSSRAEVSALRDERGAHVGVLAMFDDLSRKRAASVGPPASQAGELLVAVGREAISGAPPDRLLEFALERLATGLRADMTVSWRIDARSSEVVVEAGQGWPEDAPRSMPIDSPDTEIVLPEAPVAFGGGLRPSRGGFLEGLGVRSGIAVPLTGHGRSGGALAVYSRQARSFSPQELEAVVAVAELIGAARARVRLARIEGDLDVARRQASLGALISGIAHDFNNMLSVMLGYARLMEDEAQGSEILAEGVAEIEAAARHAMRLSRGLVDLGRPHQTEPEALEVDAVLREVAELLHRTIGEAIELRVDVEAPGVRVLMPPGELDRVVVNLVANSRDALPDGGTILVRAYCDRGPAGEGGLGGAGTEHVLIEISDDGVGMTEEVLARVLEPSFTTKERGKGSGIGLPAAETIVRAAGGALEIESGPHEGTTVRVRLPVHAD